MSALDDARTLVQDIVVPDLKALSARVDALEASIKQRFESVEKLAEARHELMVLRMDAGFAAADAKSAAAFAAIDAKLAAADTKSSAGFAAVDAKFAAMLAAGDAKFAAALAAMEARFATMDARFAAADVKLETIIRNQDVDQRLKALESERGLGKASEELHA